LRQALEPKGWQSTAGGARGNSGGGGGGGM
jgi:hypothetical protein